MADTKKAIEYHVLVPFTGTIYATVIATSREDAVTKALEAELKIEDCESWQMHREICQGNVFRGDLNRAYAEEA